MTDTVRVPREATEAMIEAAQVYCHADRPGRASDIYRAMLAASPQGEGSSGDTTNMIAPVEAVAWRDIATAPRQEPVLVGHSGFLGWRRLAICNALGEWSYCDRPWLQQDPLDETPTHWMPLPPAPSAHPAPIKPSGDTGELRERVAQIIEAAIERHNPGNSLRHTIDDADAILDLIQSERAG